ncbi:MAG TPA: DUF4188 domain-containing protein [Natronosporangium sp.]|nr:DUF4188 domain-containing protein [Natronosporangium sp.]
MAAVVPGRMAAQLDGDFVVFMVGMRINKWWKVHRWLPVFLAMRPMVKTLFQRPELGLLHVEYWLSPRGPMVVQYWRSVEQLEAFARDPALPHHPQWRAFNRAVGSSGDVGIWHESYLVRAGDWEALYANMPRFGAAAAGALVPVTLRGNTAAERRRAGRATADPAAPTGATPAARDNS